MQSYLNSFKTEKQRNINAEPNTDKAAHVSGHAKIERGKGQIMKIANNN